MYNRHTNIIVCFFLLLATLQFTSYKKDGVDKTTVSFVNQLDADVTLYIYETEEDYANSTNYVERTTILKGGVARFPGEKFVTGRVYFMDWFTADYYYNNWYNDRFPIYEDRVRFTPKTSDNSYYIQSHLRGNNRRAFLNGESTSTKWIAIGAFLFSNNTGYSNQWSVLSNNERFRQIEIFKSGIAEYTHRNSSGNSVTQNLQVMIHESEHPFIEFKDDQNNTLGNMTGGKLPTSTAPGYATSAVDTVMALFPDNEYIFMMLRQ